MGYTKKMKEEKEKKEKREEKMEEKKKERGLSLASLVYLIAFNFKTQFGVIYYQTSKNMTLSFPYLGRYLPFTDGHH